MHPVPKIDLTVVGLIVLRSQSNLEKQWYFENKPLKNKGNDLIMQRAGTYTLKLSNEFCTDSASHTLTLPVDDWFSVNSFFPNPVESDLYIKLSQTGTTEYIITDSNGVELLREHREGNQGEIFNIQAEHLAQGMYYLRIGAETHRFIKK